MWQGDSPHESIWWSITRINREQSPFPDDNNVHSEFGKKWAVKEARPATGTRAKYPNYFRAEKTNKVPNSSNVNRQRWRERGWQRDNGRRLCALFNLFRALECARAHGRCDAPSNRSAWSPHASRLTRDYAPLRFEFEFDRRNRRARHVIESWSRKLWSIREFATSIGKDVATSAQHRYRDHREICRGYIKAKVVDRVDFGDPSDHGHLTVATRAVDTVDSRGVRTCARCDKDADRTLVPFIPFRECVCSERTCVILPIETVVDAARLGTCALPTIINR